VSVVPDLRLNTEDGVSLEAELAMPHGATAVVVLAHPHPLYGGSMRTGVPDALFRSLPDAGIGALRFNFRGVEGSGGSHDAGGAERLDVGAAVAAVPLGLDVVVCGWSFGADVSLCVTHDRISAWCAVAAPLGAVPIENMAAAGDPRPKLLLVPEHDQYSAPARTRDLTATWRATTVEVLPGADHFLAGSLRAVARRVDRFVVSTTA